MEDIVIVSAARTAVGKFGGSLAKVAAPELGSIVIREAIARAGLASDQIGEVIMGQVLAAGAGQVALVNGTTALTCNLCSSNSSVIDFVGFGGASDFEGSAPAPSPGTSNTVAVEVSYCNSNS